MLWKDLPDFILKEINCTYDNTSGGQEKEKNCFQDFVTGQIINVANLESKITEIIDDVKFKYTEYNIHYKDPNNMNGTDLAAINTYQEISSNLVIQEEKSNYLYPELAVFMGELQILTNNLARKEGLLRYYTNFFYGG